MNRTRIEIAKSDIVKFLDSLPSKVLRQSDIARILSDNRAYWRLTSSTTTPKFIEFLVSSAKLSQVRFPFPKPYSEEVRYRWGDVHFYDLALTLKPHCHFSHYTAAWMHGLTEQTPKTTYINFEQPLPSNSTGELSQRGIDMAFKRPVRTTHYIAETEQFRVCILNGKNTGYLGVVDDVPLPVGAGPGRVRATGVERTLIDIAVRPVYSGGVFEVLKSYRSAREQEKVSVNKLVATLQKLRYIYPYHQVVGFYLHRAGYEPPLVDLLRRFPMEFDFHLEHNMRHTDYVKEWRLYVPKGF